MRARMMAELVFLVAFQAGRTAWAESPESDDQEAPSVVYQRKVDLVIARHKIGVRVKNDIKCDSRTGHCLVPGVGLKVELASSKGTTDQAGVFTISPREFVQGTEVPLTGGFKAFVDDAAYYLPLDPGDIEVLNLT